MTESRTGRNKTAPQGTQLDGVERIVRNGDIELAVYEYGNPDGETIVYECNTVGRDEIDTIPSSGGRPRKLLSDGFEDQTPVYSADGKFLYFASTKSGRFEICERRRLA